MAFWGAVLPYLLRGMCMGLVNLGFWKGGGRVFPFDDDAFAKKKKGTQSDMISEPGSLRTGASVFAKA